MFRTLKESYPLFIHGFVYIIQNYSEYQSKKTTRSVIKTNQRAIINKSVKLVYNNNLFSGNFK